MLPEKTDRKLAPTPQKEQLQAAQDFLRHMANTGRLRLLYLKIRLCYERLRLGTDVPSPYLYRNQRYLQQKIPGLKCPFLHLTIGQWLCLLDSFTKKDNKNPSL